MRKHDVMFRLFISSAIFLNFSITYAEILPHLCAYSCEHFNVKLNEIEYTFDSKTGIGKPLEKGKGKKLTLPSDGDGMENIKLFVEDKYYIFTYRFIGMDADNLIVVFDKKDLKLLWDNAIQNWNIGPLKVFEDSLLVVAHAYMARLRISDGKAMWEHNDLYEKYEADSFSDIRVQTDKLIFISNVGEFHIKPDSGSLLKAPALSNRKCKPGMYGCRGHL